MATSERRRLVAFVDASAFYCSCERLFRPDLRGKPVVVLSNNDGCVIARSPEAKALGVEMGAPYFKVCERLERLGVAVFSSNYALYHDLSARMMRVLERFSPHVEAYSIDEAFLAVEADPRAVAAERARLEAWAREVRQSVWAATRIPVRVAVAETKTLAKVGSELVRHDPVPCVCFWGHPDRESVLAELPVRDVWGVGPRWARRLAFARVTTAARLAAMDDGDIRRHYNVVLLRTALELRGVSCLPLERCPPPRHSLVRSRMFGRALTDPEPIGQAVAHHAATAAARLRGLGLAAGVVEAFVTTGRHARPTWHGRAVAELAAPTNDTLVLTKAARRLAENAFRAEVGGARVRYTKAGVILTGIGPAGEGQADLFRPPAPESPALMDALDAATRRFGASAVVAAAQGTPDHLRAVLAGTAEGGWGMARRHLSPRYTTCWADLPEARL